MPETVEQQPPEPIQARDDRKKCIACREPIDQEAVVCFHCQTRQKRDVWHVPKAIVKGIGAVTLIVTILAGVATFWQGVEEIKKLNEARSQRDAAINEMINSTEVLRLDLGDIDGASSLARKTLELDPTHAKARDARLDLAMAKVRQFIPSRGEGDPDPLETLRAELLFGAGLKGQKGTEVLAHIAWVNHDLNNLISSDLNLPVREYFEQAKSKGMDPDNPYLHVLEGSWHAFECFRERACPDAANAVGSYIKAIHSAANYKPENKKDKKDFDKAIEEAVDEVKRIIWLHLSLFGIHRETLMIANAYREEDGELSDREARVALRNIWGTFCSADELEGTVAKLGLDKLELTYKWLLGKLPQTRDLSPVKELADDYAEAKLAELKGDRDKALTELRRLRLVAHALARKAQEESGDFELRRSLAGAIQADLLRLFDMRVAWLGLDWYRLEAHEFEQVTGSAGEGFVVRDVDADGPAARAGIRRGDIIIKRDDWLMAVWPTALVLKGRPEEKITLVVHKQGVEHPVSVELGAMEAGKVEDAEFGISVLIDLRLYGEDVLVIPAFEAVLSPLTAYLREIFDIKPEQKGVVLLNTDSEISYHAGDLILQVEDKPVATPREFWRHILNAVSAGETQINLTLSKGGQVELSSLELPGKEDSEFLFVVPGP
jgi:hypothetical protein